MADQPFNQTIINPLEKPLSANINQAQSQVNRGLREVLNQLFSSRNGAVGGSLQVVQNSPTGLSVVMKAGIGFMYNAGDCPAAVGGVLGNDDLGPYKPIVLGGDLVLNVPTPPGSNSRIDLIEVQYLRQVDNPQSVQLLNPAAGAFAPSLLAKTLDFNVDSSVAFYSAAATPNTAIAYKSGVPGASPSPPATDAGYMALAYVTVASGAVTIVTANIQDLRTNLAGNGAWIGRKVFSGSSGTYTPTLGTSRVVMKMVGGGGGAGNVTVGSGSNVGTSGGGGSGRYIEVVCGTGSLDGGTTQTHGLITGGAYTVGAAGLGGAAGSIADGQDGGDTTIVVNGHTWTAKGGKHSAGTAASAPPYMVNGGDTQFGSDEFTSLAAGLSQGSGGAPGTLGVALDVNNTLGGNGGSNPLGVGGLGKNGAAGSLAGGYGGGGGGTSNTAGGTTSHSGGAGTGGLIIIDEYF